MTNLANLGVYQQDDVSVATLSGAIDISNVADLSTALEASVPQAAIGLIVDLSQTTYLDSSGIHLLFQVGKQLGRRRQEIRAVVPRTSPIMRVLELVAFERMVPLHATLDDALAAMRAAG